MPVMTSKKTQSTLKRIYDLMQAHYGPTHWWPGDTPFEIAVGAILTQNTAWTNVVKAIMNLKRENLLTPEAILACPNGHLETALIPSGYFRVKAQRLRSFCQYLANNHDGSMERLAEQPLETLRPELLSVHGIGPETADDILLYACEKPVFVIDAYTRRILDRHNLIDSTIPYEDLRQWFEIHVPKDLHTYKEYHALIVYIAKDHCRRTPKCEQCPLNCLKRVGRTSP